MAPRVTLERAVRLAQTEGAYRLDIVGDGRVEGVFGADGFLRAGIRIENGRARTNCDCNEWSDQTGCRHSCAVFAATMGAIHGKFPGGVPVPERQLREFRRVLRIEQPKGEKNSAATQKKGGGLPSKPSLLLHANGELRFSWRGHLPRDFWRELKELQDFRTYGYLAIPGSNRVAHTKVVFDAAAKNGVDIVLARRRDEKEEALRWQNEAMQSALMLDLNATGQITGKIVLRDSHGEVLPDIIEDSGEIVVLENGQVVPILGTCAAGRLLDRIEDGWVRSRLGGATFTTGHDPEKSREANDKSWTAGRFLEASASVGNTGSEEFLENTILLQESRPVAFQELPTLPGRLIGRFETLGNERHRFRLELVIDGIEERLAFAPAELQRRLTGIEQERFLSRSDKRMNAVLRAATALREIPRKAAAKEYIAAFVRSEETFDTVSKSRARQLLEKFHSQLTDELVAPPKTLLVASALDGKPTWGRLRIPTEDILRISEALLAETGRLDDGMLGNFVDLSSTEKNAVLGPLMRAIQRGGGEIRIDNNRVVREELSINVDVTEREGEIDWFELRAEVMCREFKIPEEEWERLMAGGAILQPDGTLLMAEQKTAEALRSLVRLAGGGGEKGARGKQAKEGLERVIRRLAIFDWIEMTRSGANVRVPPHIGAMIDSLKNLERLPSTPLPEGFRAKLRDYQKTGYDWLAFLYQHRFGACLADDMGLGKTLQAIAFLHGLKTGTIPAITSATGALPPHLVVVPPSLVFNWVNEIHTFCPDLIVAEHTGSKRELAGAIKADVVLTTYDLVRREITIFKAQPFHVVVFDETQLLKNHTAARSRAAAELSRSFTLCLTGTPMENHVGEYYSIIELAVPGLFGEYKEFNKESKTGGGNIIPRARPFVLRRTKQEILKDLPPKVEQNIHLEMTEEQKEIYTRTIAEVREEVRQAYSAKSAAQAGIVALTALMRLRQVCISPEILGKPLEEPAPKIRYLIDKLEELHEQGHAALVFSQFTKALDVLEKVLRQTRFNVLRLDGSTPQPKRKGLVEAFQTSTEPHIFLISLKAGGVGLNLTRANYVFHLDPWWNPAVENQATDRAHRMGQQQHVFVQRLLMLHTVEEQMTVLKAKKRVLFDTIMGQSAGQGGAKSDGSAFSRDDFEFLLGG